VKCLFKHRKTRYRGLAKNNAQLFTLFGFANLVCVADATERRATAWMLNSSRPRVDSSSCRRILI
jgi:hypothetical protein